MARTPPKVAASLHSVPASAESTGSQAWLRMSHTRNTSTPTATPLSAAFSRGRGFRRRPMGRPRKIVTPAIAPRRAMLLWDMGLLSAARGPDHDKRRLPCLDGGMDGPAAELHNPPPDGEPRHVVDCEVPSEVDSCEDRGAQEHRQGPGRPAEPVVGRP